MRIEPTAVNARINPAEVVHLSQRGISPVRFVLVYVDSILLEVLLGILLGARKNSFWLYLSSHSTKVPFDPLDLTSSIVI